MRALAFEPGRPVLEGVKPETIARMVSRVLSIRPVDTERIVGYECGYDRCFVAFLRRDGLQTGRVLLVTGGSFEQAHNAKRFCLTAEARDLDVCEFHPLPLQTDHRLPANLTMLEREIASDLSRTGFIMSEAVRDFLRTAVTEVPGAFAQIRQLRNLRFSGMEILEEIAGLSTNLRLPELHRMPGFEAAELRREAAWISASMGIALSHAGVVPERSLALFLEPLLQNEDGRREIMSALKEARFGRIDQAIQRLKENATRILPTISRHTYQQQISTMLASRGLSDSELETRLRSIGELVSGFDRLGIVEVLKLGTIADCVERSDADCGDYVDIAIDGERSRVVVLRYLQQIILRLSGAPSSKAV